MIKSTLGAPLGGTTVGGQYGLESAAISLMTVPNFGSVGGNSFPSLMVVAYLILPRLWKRHEMRHAVFDDSPRVTQTASDIPGDPLNIALVGTEEEVIRAMTAARWDPADALTLRSSVRIVVDTVLKKPDDQAPVSNLYLFGRKEDLAFEKPVGGSPKERHHVRFWHM